MKQHLSRWQANFYTGLAIVLPAIISIAILKWLFGTVSNFTDPLLFFLPKEWTHDPLTGVMYWWWSLVALGMTAMVISLLGRFARNFLLKKVIQSADALLLNVPLLNKLYGAIKQVNAAFTTGNRSAFQQVVLIEFPRAGLYSLGFITSDLVAEVQQRLGRRVLSVYVPTTPNPTSGYQVLVPDEQVTRLDMTVSEGIKFILSLGSVSPPYSQAPLSVGDGRGSK
jgi:uncharacterized membrane protein